MKRNAMLKSLKSRILFGILGILFLTNFSILFVVQRATERALSDAQKENARNLTNTVLLNVENQYKSILFHKEASLERRKKELRNIATLALVVVEGYYQDYRSGKLSENAAKAGAIEELKRFRYDDDVGYLWVNDTERPFPRMIMHPTIPSLDGEILDDPGFNLALGIRKNLFVAMVDVALDKGEGYVDYLWPKPTSDGLTAEQPKISYVTLFREWNWVLGTGVYIDDIENDVQLRINAVLDELKDTFSRIRIADSGYMYIINGNSDYLIHPSLEGTNGRSDLNPQTGNPILEDLIQASFTPDIPFEYIWDKPGHEGDFRFQKLAYISYFKPLDWYIGSSIYMDEIVKPARIVGRQILIISLLFIAASVVLALLLSNNVTAPLRKLMLSAQTIEKGGTLETDIPVSGTMETKELGMILGQMIQSIKKTGGQLQQAQKMETVGTLAGGLAHDFNNMLGGIVGTLSLIENKLEVEGSVAKDKMEEYLGIMYDCSARASSMVQQLLSLSRKQELTLANVDLNALVSHVVRICENSFDKSVRLESFCLNSPALVKADSSQIEQALLNFCINGEHAMTLMRGNEERWGGVLTLSIEELNLDNYFCQIHTEARPGRYYQISVKDTGVGMDMTTVAKIFNPFFTTKNKGEGTGLGLSMVYNIIKMHEGFIDVYSEPGNGTLMKIYLPALSHELTVDAGEHVKTEPSKGEGLILIVDDERAMRSTAGEILTTIGYSVMTARNGLEGVDAFRKHHEEIDAVLLDMAMPEMSGKEAFLKMKEIDPNVKVILTSGFRQDERVEDLMKRGVKVFIQKPYTYEKLTEVFHRLLQT